ncbi:MAG: histidine phosphatase family protein [Candidatus Nanohaloarchaea archaeon]
MTEVYLVRHGESEHNSRNLIQGQINSELTQRGRLQAKNLREKLSDIEFDGVYSSDLSRAYETAEILVEDRAIEIKETEKLRERHLGELHDEPSQRWHEIETEDHHEWKPEEGESLKEHKDRASEVLGEVTEEDYERVLVVCHGGTIRAMIAYILNCDSRQVWRLELDNCSVTGLERFRDGWKIKYVNRKH